jgi:hypothetical protein
MPLVTDIADAVVAALNAATFSLPLTAERHYVPRFDLADMQTLHVSVVPKERTDQLAARGGAQQDVAVDIAVQQKLASDDLADIDPLLALAEEIGGHFRGKRLDSFPEAIWVKTEHRPIYAPEHLEQLRQFTSVLTLTFRVIK